MFLRCWERGIEFKYIRLNPIKGLNILKIFIDKNYSVVKESIQAEIESFNGLVGTSFTTDNLQLLNLFIDIA